MTLLLDSNVMVALGVTGHVHHAVARDWFAVLADQFSTTPITQGSLIRLIVREGRRASDAIRVLDSIRDHPRHEFWPDAVAYTASMLARVTGHAGVTDAYLVALARHHGGRLMTFDAALAATYPDTVDLLPTA